MNVARILQEKGRDVLTTQPYRTMREVAALLGSRGVGAVVVADVVGRCSGSSPSATSFARSASSARRRWPIRCPGT